MFVRKGIMKGLLVLVSLSSLVVACSNHELREKLLDDKNKNLELRFRKNHKFKIVQFTDTQDDQDCDPRTIELISAVCDDQKPDLVVFTGDNIRSGPETEEDVIVAINNIVSPVDSRKIPWFITYGNHDEDHSHKTGIDETKMLELYMSYPYNINKESPKDITGTGNMFVLIRDSKGKSPVFNIWGLDSNRYAPESINGQSLEGFHKWDIIHYDQIQWYVNNSKKIEKAFGRLIPSFMFFHIPLFEFEAMWQRPERHGIVGERNERVCSGPFNSGLFAILLDRGDVRGVFVGHDHINDFIGNYYGIYLGYAASAGFATYGLSGDEKHRMRGARIFILNEKDIENFETYMVYAKDYGIH